MHLAKKALVWSLLVYLLTVAGILNMPNIGTTAYDGQMSVKNIGSKGKTTE